ncbi:MAG TPA: hypothetical protein VFE79_21830 [Paraburkholderia sp.]|jgi:hypothetical protein|nr:hypothetical protein [Paraburkholderia sp.]
MTTYEANEVFQLTPATTLMGGYWYSKLDAQKWQNVTLLLDHALSKRTDVYTSATYLRASGGAAPGISRRWRGAGVRKRRVRRHGPVVDRGARGHTHVVPGVLRMRRAPLNWPGTRPSVRRLSHDAFCALRLLLHVRYAGTVAPRERDHDTGDIG